MTQHVTAGILMMLIGAAVAFKPDQVWKMMDAWKNSAGGNVTKLYQLVLRAVGTVIAVCGLMVLVFGH